MKGIISLDIDGTITAEHHDLDPKVSQFLEGLIKEGWQLIFITGRTFLWGYEVLRHLNAHFYFAVQNGAIILDMPSRKTVMKKYLDASIIAPMDKICENEESDYIIYTGFENNDLCYYRPHKFSPSLLQYINYRTTTLRENWVAVESYDKLPIKEFASIKCFGNEQAAQRITEKIENTIGLHVPIIKDPFDMRMYVVQATHQEVSKGFALKDFKKYMGHKGISIAAGDDNNDRSMLKEADIRVVMATAPEDMIKSAHVVAPPAKENGIITGLQQAIALATARERSSK